MTTKTKTETYPESLVEIEDTERVSIAPRNAEALSRAEELVASFTARIVAREALRAELVEEAESDDPRKWYVAKGALGHPRFSTDKWTDGSPKNNLDRGLLGAEKQIEELNTSISLGVAAANALASSTDEDTDTGRPVIPDAFPIVVAGGKVPEASEPGVIYVVVSNEVVHTESVAEAVIQLVVDCDPDYRAIKAEDLGLLLRRGDIFPKSGGFYSCQSSTSMQGAIRRTVVTVNNRKPVLWREGSWKRKVSADHLERATSGPSVIPANMVR